MYADLRAVILDKGPPSEKKTGAASSTTNLVVQSLVTFEQVEE